jgi:hypothetical protein
MDRHSKAAQIQADIARICEIGKAEIATTESVVDLARFLARYPQGAVNTLISNVLQGWGMTVEIANEIAKEHWRTYQHPRNQIVTIECGSGADAP